ncbi:hypothetical protein EBR78_10045 [bacterium]|nr:hypothetical protein [bacterium]
MKTSLTFLFPIFLSCWIGAGTAFAAISYPYQSQWQLLLGTAVSQLTERLEAPAGFESKTSEIQGLLGIKRAIRLSNRWRVSPEAFLVLPWRSDSDGFSFTLTSHWSVNFDFLASSVFSFSLGTGLLWESHFSQAEELTVGGIASAGTFYKPSSWVQVVLPTAVAGMGVRITRKATFQVGVLVPQFYSNQKRVVTGTGRLVIDL